jgi:outer membrane protein TolC
LIDVYNSSSRNGGGFLTPLLITRRLKQPGLCRQSGCFSAALLSLLILTPVSGFANVQRLEPLLINLLKTNKKIKGASIDIDADKDRLKMEKGNYFPVVDVTVNKGFENIDGEGTSSDSNFNFHEVDVKLTQTVWDFGATNSDVRKAVQEVSGKRLVLEQKTQESLVEGITTFLEVKRASIILDFAKKSELNIKRQTGLEEILLEEGAGLTSDLIQAKKQLAESQTKWFNAELEMITNINSFKKIFATTPIDIETFEDVDFSLLSHIPLTLNEAVARTVKNNQDIKLAIVDIDNAQEDVIALRSRSFFPTIEGILEQKWKTNVGGTAGEKQELLGKLELSVPISLGLTEYNEYKASIKDKDSTTITMEVLRDDTVEEVRNAWQTLLTSTLKWKSLRRQADLAAASLELAYKEKAFGIRSQIDVLSSETALFTAQSDASSARIDILVDGLSLLALMGDINIGILSRKILAKNHLLPSSLPFFHQNISSKPSKRVAESLKKIATNTSKKIEIGADSDKKAEKPAVPAKAPTADGLLSDEEKNMQLEHSTPDDAGKNGAADQKAPKGGDIEKLDGKPDKEAVDPAADTAPVYDVDPDEKMLPEEEDDPTKINSEEEEGPDGGLSHQAGSEPEHRDSAVTPVVSSAVYEVRPASILARFGAILSPTYQSESSAEEVMATAFPATMAPTSTYLPAANPGRQEQAGESTSFLSWVAVNFSGTDQAVNRQNCSEPACTNDSNRLLQR